MILTGTIVFIKTNVGSKSEGSKPFLQQSDGKLLAVWKPGDPPFGKNTFCAFEGKTVRIEGHADPDNLFIVNTVAELDASSHSDAP